MVEKQKVKILIKVKAWQMVYQVCSLQIKEERKGRLGLWWV
jgi:hypothetical protein